MTVYDVPPNLDGNQIALSNPLVYMQNEITPTTDGVTPSRSIGAVRKAELTFIIEEVIQKQGFPMVETNQWNMEQGLEIAIVAEEETAEKMGWLTCGETSAGVLYFGGQIKKPVVQCRITKTLTGETTAVYDIWKMVPAGSPKKVYELGAQSLMEYNFRAQYSTRTFVNTAIASNEHLMRYTLS